VLGPGDVVTISGELGAGKTTFVRGAVRALGVTARVTSPTYTIGQRYDGVSHLDLYRLERVAPADWGSLEPYFEDAVCFVEWPEAAAGWLPAPRVEVSLSHEGAARRLVVLESTETGMLESIFGGVDSRS
jgi:tRNA threonylcarbamoyladenosine biosynthesis protein TsaE